MYFIINLMSQSKLLKINHYLHLILDNLKSQFLYSEAHFEEKFKSVNKSVEASLRFKKNLSLSVAHWSGLYNSVQKDFQTSFLGQGHLIAWHLKMLINGFWIIKSRFLLFGTKLARNQHKNIQHFWWFFSFCPFYGQKMQEKVSKP